MTKYIVSTHIGDFETYALTPRKVLNNIRFRLFGRSGYVNTTYWTVKEA